MKYNFSCKISPFWPVTPTVPELAVVAGQAMHASAIA